MSVLPYDNIDIDTMLEQLQTHAFILRYESNGIRYIQVTKFEKHQYPHVREPDSIIPAPYKHHASTGRKRLNPESPILNPESPIPVTPGGVNPYPIPDPKTEPQKCLVLSYKSRKGIAYNNRDWDKGNFGRCMAAAGTLLALCRDLSSAETCLNDLAVEYESKSLSWTLETVARNASEWLQKNGRTDANASRAGLRMAIAQRKSEGRDQTNLVKIPERTTSDAIRDGPNTENENKKNGERSTTGFNATHLE